MLDLSIYIRHSSIIRCQAIKFVDKNECLSDFNIILYSSQGTSKLALSTLILNLSKVSFSNQNDSDNDDVVDDNNNDE
jgi:hypothetical protein